MRFFLRLLHTPRAFGALILLATLVGGEVADARHHVTEEACAAESHAPGNREENCTCAALHAVPIGVVLAAIQAPIGEEREFAPDATAAAHREHRGTEAAPRAPPQG